MVKLPFAPITKEHLAHLLAVLFVYRNLLDKEPLSPQEKLRAYLVLESLIARMTQAMQTPLQQQETFHLTLSVDDVHLLKSALETEITILKRNVSSQNARSSKKKRTSKAELEVEIHKLTGLQNILKNSFSTTHD